MMNYCGITAIIFAGIAVGQTPAQSAVPADSLRIGWAQADITPQRTACLGGMTSVRIAKEVMDPLTATALVLEAPGRDGNSQSIILVSCDLRRISDEIRDGVRAVLKTALPEVDSMRIILNATHTHNAPPLNTFGLPLDGMDEREYTAFAVPRIAAAAEQAWKKRRSGGISFGLAHAVIAHNRITAYDSGKSLMGGSLDRPDFSHLEGYEDPAVQLLYTWDAQRKLTGVVVNVSCTAQVSQSLSVISADFWHDTRQELRRRLGKDLFVLPQCSATGDQMPLARVYRRAEERMERLTGHTRRQQIALRVADAVTSILPVMEKNIDWTPGLEHRAEIVPLTRRLITKEDVQQALASAEKPRQFCEAALRQAKEKPELLKNTAWLQAATRAYWDMRRGEVVRQRYEAQQAQPRFSAELHAIRLGEIAMAINPFELYMDFGIQIKTRSKAVQTFVVQLAGGVAAGGESMGYVPTARAVAGGAYGAVPASTNVGPEGGKDLVNWTVAAINSMWVK